MSSPADLAPRVSPALAAVRALLAPVAALAAATIAALVQPDVVAMLTDPAVAVVGGGHPAALVFGLSLLAPAAAAAVTLTARRGGPALALALAPVLALLSVPLARDVRSAWQLGFVVALAAATSGALLGAGLSMAALHSGRTQPLTVLGWVLPLLVVPAATAWWRAPPAEGAVAVMAEPPAVVLSVAVGLAVGFGVLALGIPMRMPPWQLAGAQSAVGWLVAALAVLAIAGLLMSWHAGSVELPWLRMLVLVGSVGVLALLAIVAWPLGGHPLASAYLTMVVTGAMVLPVLSFGAAQVAGAKLPISPTYAVAALVASVLFGGGIGACFAVRGVMLGGLAGCVLAVAATVAPAMQWWQPLAVLAVLAGSAAAALGAGVRRAVRSQSQPAVMFLAVGFATAALMGDVVQYVVAGWALGGDLPRDAADMVVSGRIAGGIAVSALVLATAAVAVLSRSESRRVTPEADVTIA